MSINLTLFGQMITFGLFVWFTMRFVWPPIMMAMNDREKRIADGLAAAEKAQNDLQLSKKKIVDEIKQAKLESSIIIENASKKAVLIIDEAKSQSKEEGLRLIKAAKIEVQHEILQAKQSLQHDVSKMAVLGIEKVIGKHLDQKAHQKLIDDVLKEIN